MSNRAACVARASCPCSRGVARPSCPYPPQPPRYPRRLGRDARGIRTVRYWRIVPEEEECAKGLKRWTLTNLYNQRPTWLDLAHKRLDEAASAAYGWEPDISDERLLANLLDLNLQRAARQT